MVNVHALRGVYFEVEQGGLPTIYARAEQSTSTMLRFIIELEKPAERARCSKQLEPIYY